MANMLERREYNVGKKVESMTRAKILKVEKFGSSGIRSLMNSSKFKRTEDELADGEFERLMRKVAGWARERTA